MKQKWVKRMTALLLAGVMVFSLTACSSSSSDDEEETEAEEEEAEEEEAEAEESVVIEGAEGEIEATTILDTDEISVVVTGLSLGGTDGDGVDVAAALTVEIENKTEEADLVLDIWEMYLNGLAAGCDTEDDYPGAGETAELTFYIYGDYLYVEEAELGDITDIFFSCEAWEAEFSDYGYEYVGYELAAATVHIYPDGEESASAYERMAGDTDIVLMEDPVTVTNIGVEDEEYEDEWDGCNVNFFVENPSETDVAVVIYLVSVNGMEESESSGMFGYGVDLLAGTCGYVSLYLDGESYLEELEITEKSQIETVEVLIEVSDPETYDAIASENYTVALN